MYTMSASITTPVTQTHKTIHQRPQVGIGVLIIRDNKVLLGKRKSAHGHGCWGPPGGHLEFAETFQECAQREVLEETGMHVTQIFQGPTTNDIFYNEGKQYVSIFMIAYNTREIPRVTEPDKCECWHWFAFDQLPNPLFLPLQNLLEKQSLTSLIAQIKNINSNISEL
jgi:8-oxo-dGTP diphosphatase